MNAIYNDLNLMQVVLNLCGRRIAWAWFFAAAVLALLMCPDREAAGVFLALGYYPILKIWLDRRKLPALWKGLYFNISILFNIPSSNNTWSTN